MLSVKICFDSKLTVNIDVVYYTCITKYVWAGCLCLQGNKHSTTTEEEMGRTCTFVDFQNKLLFRHHWLCYYNTDFVMKAVECTVKTVYRDVFVYRNVEFIDRILYRGSVGLKMKHWDLITLG